MVIPIYRLVIGAAGEVTADDAVTAVPDDHAGNVLIGA
jgi:hypothetical protein